jgi:uncharacterized protein YndB with AHSA1/START domain
MSQPLNNSITIQAIIQSNISKVWYYYTSPQHVTGWNFASLDWCCPSATNDLKVGGVFSSRMEAKDGSFGFDFGGFYTQVENEKLICYTMGKPEGEPVELARKVEVIFETISDEETKITVNFEPETENPIEMQQVGWQSILDNFKQYTEQVYQDQTTMMAVNATISSTLI